MLKRDKRACLARLVTTKDNSVLTKEHCRIQIPERWLSVGLGSSTGTTLIYGFFPIIFDDNTYCVLSTVALFEITPSRTTQVTINDETYFEYHFDKDSMVISSLNLVRQDTLTFNVMDEFIMKGKFPWWGTLDDLCMIFDTAQKHAGSNIAKTSETIEFLAGIVARRIDERSRPLRLTANDKRDFDLERIEFIPLRSVLEALSNTVSKLSGAHFGDGVVSAIVNPSTKTGRVEKILRA